MRFPPPPFSPAVLFPATSSEILFFLCALAQVLRIRYKGISPERPLSNVFTAYRSITYDLAWESQGKPQVVYISFIR